MMMPVLAKNAPQPDDADNPVRLFYGSPAFAPEFLADFEQRFGTDIIVGFGMTETCYGTIESIGGERRPNSSGQPRRHPDPAFENAVRIVNDAGQPVPNGQPGEITIRNPATMAGYWRNPAETAAALREGWLFTGDLGWLDDDGYLYFVDRKKGCHPPPGREYILPGSGGCHQAPRKRPGLRHHRRAFGAGGG